MKRESSANAISYIVNVDVFTSCRVILVKISRVVVSICVRFCVLLGFYILFRCVAFCCKMLVFESALRAFVIQLLTAVFGALSLQPEEVFAALASVGDVDLVDVALSSE